MTGASRARLSAGTRTEASPKRAASKTRARRPVKASALTSIFPGVQDGPPPRSADHRPFFVVHHPLELPELDPDRNRLERRIAQPEQDRVLELADAPECAGMADIHGV